jgi:predicted TIM-barrel fold metal-dependent hydrolase
MRIGNETAPLPAYEDHIGLWKAELRDWLPDTIFDAHVHLGLPEFLRPYSPARLKEPLATFGSLSWEEFEALHAQLFEGRELNGAIAFPWPLSEVDFHAANGYIIRVMQQDPRLKGFFITHPTDMKRTHADYDRAMREGVRFSGVKPYFDFLGKSNYETKMTEFVPEPLLAFVNAEELIVMLHTSGRGMGVPENQKYLRAILDRYPRVRIILAHMGRYLEAEEFYRFADTDLFEHPNLYLEMSSASQSGVYAKALENETTHDRLVFGTDFPYGLITGVEAWSQETGPVFITRDRYVWSDDRAQRKFAAQAQRLTYNTYHVILSFKQALETVVKDAAQAEEIKRRVFHDNAAALFEAG